jgi:hypothetical protein
MRLLLCPDVQWSECDVEALPIWLLETDQAATLRDFCIDHGRPRAAFEFAMRSRHVRTPPLSNRDFVDFVLEQAQSRLDRPAVAMALLQAAITDMSRGQNPVVEDIPLRLFICQLRTKSGQYLVAAGEAHVAWERAKAAGSSWAGKAAVAELVSLYRAEQYESVIALSKDYRGEDACREYLPEILFLMWSAAREKNIPDDTKEAEQTLLDKFPNHPVLVDVYLVKALRLGIGGDVREAIRQLLLVESQFPDSAGAAKAASIRNGLEKRASGLRNP